MSTEQSDELLALQLHANGLVEKLKAEYPSDRALEEAIRASKEDVLVRLDAMEFYLQTLMQYTDQLLGEGQLLQDTSLQNTLRQMYPIDGTQEKAKKNWDAIVDVSSLTNKLDGNENPKRLAQIKLVQTRYVLYSICLHISGIRASNQVRNRILKIGEGVSSLNELIPSVKQALSQLLVKPKQNSQPQQGKQPTWIERMAGFFRKNWQRLLLGALIGATLVVATVLTLGVAGVIAGGIAAGLAAVGGGSAAAGAAVVSCTGALAGGLVAGFAAPRRRADVVPVLLAPATPIFSYNHSRLLDDSKADLVADPGQKVRFADAPAARGSSTADLLSTFIPSSDLRRITRVSECELFPADSDPACVLGTSEPQSAELATSWREESVEREQTCMRFT